MKNLMALLLSHLRNGKSRRSILILLRFLSVLLVLITVYSVVFHLLMQREGQEYSWVTGFYWTLTVMSTLGFGDITFHTDLGRIFSMLVLLTGMVFMLTLLPFTFIQFFYAPWMEAQTASRLRRRLDEDVEGHVILVHDDEVTRALISKLKQFRYPYVLVTADIDHALLLHDQGIESVVGELDDPQTYRNVRVEKAALLAATASDAINTNVASTARALSKDITILATADDEHSVDILELAGCNRVLRLGRLMGDALARRITGGDAMAHIIGSYGPHYFAEATTANTPLVGKAIGESCLQQDLDVSVLGLWQRGRFRVADRDTVIERNSVLVLAGSRKQIEEYSELLCIYNTTDAPIVIVGAGRVGRATGHALAERGVDYRIIEKQRDRIRDDEHYVLGSAANLEVLKSAGIMKSPAVVITSHDDDLNVYLTIYCRKLRPDIQIIARAITERNIETLHRAGADVVLSYASMAANAVFNQLKRSDVIMLAEGLDLFRIEVPESLAGRRIADMRVRTVTGCTIAAYIHEGKMVVNPDPNETLPPDCQIIIIGSDEAEDKFLKLFT